MRRMWRGEVIVGHHGPTRLKKTVGGMATYLQEYGDLKVDTNRWDPRVLERLRAHSLVAGFRDAANSLTTTEELERVATLIPEDRLAPPPLARPSAASRRSAARSTWAPTASSSTVPARATSRR